MSTDPILSALQNLETSLFDRLGGEMSRQVEGLRLELNGHFDAMAGRLDRLETEYAMVVAALHRIEGRLGDEPIDRVRVEAEISGLKARVRELEERMREAEARLDEQ